MDAVSHVLAIEAALARVRGAEAFVPCSLATELLRLGGRSGGRVLCVVAVVARAKDSAAVPVHAWRSMPLLAKKKSHLLQNSPPKLSHTLRCSSMV